MLVCVCVCVHSYDIRLWPYIILHILFFLACFPSEKIQRERKRQLCCTSLCLRGTKRLTHKSKERREIVTARQCVYCRSPIRKHSIMAMTYIDTHLRHTKMFLLHQCIQNSNINKVTWEDFQL